MSPMSPRLLRPRQSLHPEAADWAARVTAAGATYSGSTLTAVSKFCRDIDAAGIRSKFVRLNLFCGNSITAALIPLYRSTAYGGTLAGGTSDTNVNFVSADYVETGSSGGIAGGSQAGSKYLKTGLTPDAVGVAQLQFSFYSPTAANAAWGNRYPIGAANSTDFYQLRSLATTADSLSRIGGTASVQSALAAGLTLIQRESSTLLRHYTNGVLAATNTTSTTPGSCAVEFYVFSGNSNGSPVGGAYWATRLCGYAIGTSMTASQVASYTTAMQALQSSLGRQA